MRRTRRRRVAADDDDEESWWRTNKLIGGAPGAADDQTVNTETTGTRRQAAQQEEEDDDDDGIDWSKMPPEEVFKRFDTDGSGEIDLEEFKVMLKKLKIQMSSAKAVKYFKMCDVDDSGQIDFEEFRVALFACDPNNGNPIGFAPNALLTPIDAFEMFDEDGSGNINEDEFYFVLEYLKLEVSDANQERLFLKYDKDQSGEIDYDEFRQIWLAVADVKKELTDRGVDVPKFASRKKLERILEKCLDEEEEQERRAMAEAERWRTWRAILDQKNEYIKHARRRAQIELCKALDAAGQIYVFGRGARGQFGAQGEKDGTHEIVQKLWTRRVTAGKADFDPDRKMDSLETKDAIDVEALKNELASSPFNDLVVGENAAKLWGKRVYDAAISDTVILAQSDLGELWTWGGSDHWWYEIEPDAHWQTHWRGDTTPRSQLLLGTRFKPEPPPPEVDELGELNDGSEALKVVLTYYGKWSAPPPDVDRRKFYADECLPNVDYNWIVTSLEVRGKQPEEMTKLMLCDLLHRDIMLEKRVLGERAHRRIHELEEEIRELKKVRRVALAKRLVVDITKMWAPLREIQAEEDARDRQKKQTEVVENIAKREHAYEAWRQQVKEAAEATSPERTARGNSIVIESGGITARGAGHKIAQGYAAIKQIAGGAQHFAAVHQSGALYTWGLGSGGRLGLDITENGDPRADATRPTVVQALASTPVLTTACGYSHMACVTTSRDLYVWGSAASGKLGLGLAAKEEECYASLPVHLPLRPKNRPLLRTVSCGAAHTAATTTDGELFVWGCGDGGRLGLGREGLATHWSPRRVDALFEAGHKIGDVSCGNAHTLAVTLIEEVWTGTGTNRMKEKQGGQVFAAGSASVLGLFHPQFDQVMGELASVQAVQASAGFAHSGVVTSDGELYCWGMNDDGCCAAHPKVRFLAEPTLAACIYSRPGNLALGRPARQSSCYGGQDAHVAVDGNCDGSSPELCTSTQQDPQAWWEVDLGDFANLHIVKLWNRTDEPPDMTMARDKYSSRLVPCWIMASQKPYSDEVGGSSLINALGQSVARHQITRDKRCTTWHVPENISARYIRVQLEGFNFLHFAQLEVFGIIGVQGSVGRCSRVVCGKHCTVAIIRPLSDPADINRVYKRAILSDAQNADILRERETFALEYDKYGRGGKDMECIICTGGQKCENCLMKERFAGELKDLSLGAAGRVLTLDEMAEMLLDAPKPPLNFTPKVVVDNSWAGKLQQRLAGKKSDDSVKKAKVAPDDGSVASGGSTKSKSSKRSKRSRSSRGKKSEAGSKKSGGGPAAPDAPRDPQDGGARRRAVRRALRESRLRVPGTGWAT